MANCKICGRPVLAGPVMHKECWEQTEKKYDIFQAVKEIEDNGEAGRAILLLVLDMALQLKEKDDNQSKGE